MFIIACTHKLAKGINLRGSTFQRLQGALEVVVHSGARLQIVVNLGHLFGDNVANAAQVLAYRKFGHVPLEVGEVVAEFHW